ncbi:hypothetical protein KI387_002552 [Taxus chinensis]|uniref:Uncharacterized protein n=1 Tax=Taxus chinensis TaxID=29808 RepID=A0AA38GVF1_TAXCH|nr:hypothetical protein KI387_002552 [Taxus chinensis]
MRVCKGPNVKCQKTEDRSEPGETRADLLRSAGEMSAREANYAAARQALPEIAPPSAVAPAHTNGNDEKREKRRYCSPPWSVTQSPCTSEVLADGSLSAKLDTHNIWWELYAAGHMGFGGIPFERD